MTTAQLHRARRLLCSLQDKIRDDLIAARQRSSADFANIAAVTEADTIYGIDKVSEETILGWFAAEWPRSWPVEVVMEGLEGEAVTFPAGTPVSKTIWKCILDPIDGTRGIMYDKRSAWSLAGLAPQRGRKTKISDIVVAAMTELPTSKQWRADQISAVRGGGAKAVRAEWVDVRSAGAKGRGAAPIRERSRSTDLKNLGAKIPGMQLGRSSGSSDEQSGMSAVQPDRGTLHLQPSAAKDFAHGFSSIARFFPDGKTLLSAFEEAIWTELHAGLPRGSPLVFDDQYISTGGQLYEIVAGHDRFVGDLRPEAFAKLKLSSSLVCHPYDICTALIAEEAGAIVEAPLGGPIKAPLDTTTPVSWVAFANQTLARKMRPVLRKLIREMF